MHRRTRLATLAAGAALALLWTTAAAAQTGADFFKGKTVTYVIATSPGGGYDTYGRLISEFMQRHLPGSTFVVKNVPGAGHLVGANSIYSAEPDGLTIGMFNTGILYSQLIGHKGVKFDLKKMSWIGKASADPHVIVVAKHAPVKTLEELKASKNELKFASGGVGSTAYVELLLMIEAMKLPIKVLTGYNGNEEQLAMRRGEIDGSMGSRSTWEQFVKDGFGRFVGQFGGKHKDVPQVMSYANDARTKSIVSLIQVPGDIARLTAGPPGIPADRLEALRTALRKAMEDPEMQAKAEKIGRPLEPAYGEDVAKMMAMALDQSPQAITVLKEAMGTP